MQWNVTVQPVGLPITIHEMRAHLRMDAHDDEAYIIALMKSATAYAEARMNTSFMPRTMVARFHADERLILPRGPVISIESVTDANNTPVTYDTATDGDILPLALTSTARYPIKIEYVAGYADQANIPADILAVIRVHTATLYAHREAHSERSVNEVHKLDAFYSFHSRTPPVG
jgi:uncharacterized phiE125 gp8 family phage protein